MTLVKFNPERKNSALLPGFNDIFESVIGDTFFSDRRLKNIPLANISETNEAYQIELAAPGLQKEDFRVSVEKDILTISTEMSAKSVEEEKSYNRREFSYASFTRMFTLPETADIDRIEAHYDQGVLKLLLPKKEEAKAVAKQIAIR